VFIVLGEIEMKSAYNLENELAGLPLLADDIVEFHASRLLLLLEICGDKGRIEGLTKMAKLDFFVRYPQFFVKACEVLNKKANIQSDNSDANMVRYHYGPWDQRYYHVLAYLEARQLITTHKENKTFYLVLTDKGQEVAKQFLKDPSFSSIIAQMKEVKRVLGGKKGTQLKNLIYKIFDAEVAQRLLGEAIEP
jgi:DNA-binding PadR family transcriptional regulator